MHLITLLFLNFQLAEELNEIFVHTWELEDRKQTLELLRLMVKVESTKERIVLMKILQVTKDTDVLNNFIRYKGLTLLWSWMVDAPESKSKYKIEVFNHRSFQFASQTILNPWSQAVLHNITSKHVGSLNDNKIF